MYSLPIKSRVNDYEAVIITDFAADLETSLKTGDLLLVDKKVYELYESRLAPIAAKVPCLKIEAREENKSFENLPACISFILENGFKKNHRLIAVGGGIIQDITAFIATVLFRGVSWMFYPTTLLAQADSCIGSKTSINFGAFKNQLGSFYPPERVNIDLAFLDTLVHRDFMSGMGEIIKVHLLSSPDDFRNLVSAYEPALTDKQALKPLIFRALEVKRQFIEIDEFDRKERQIFNYGHSFGHAVESLTHYAIPHGLAVCFGMEMANFVSEKMGLMSATQRDDMNRLIRRNHRGQSIAGLKTGDLLAAMRQDKKNTDSRINVILSRGPGAMFKTQLPEEASAWLDEFFAEKAA